MHTEHQERPFSQSVYALEEIRVPGLSGYALRFTVILPVLWQGRLVFAEEQQWGLRRLLTYDFGGCTYSYGLAHPLFQGTYLNSEGNVVVNENAIYTVYASQTLRSQEYFRELQRRLQECSGEEKILVEMQPVVLL
jgi:hypothetical protein